MDRCNLHCGWLEKKGRFIKNWKRRWFVLRAGIIEYYEDERETEQTKRGDMAINTTTRVLMRDGTTHLFKFGIQTNDRVLELCTTSDADRIRWMDAVHNAVRGLNEVTRAKSDGTIKNKVSNLLSKKTNMEEDTLMNRALSGHGAPREAASTPSGSTKTTRRTTRRPRNTKPSASSASNTPQVNENDPHSDDSDQETVNTEGRQTCVSENTEHVEDKEHVEETSQEPQAPATPLPEGWAQVETEDGRIYYYHKVTRVSRWDLPTEEVNRAMNERLEEVHRQAERSAENRRNQREYQATQEESLVEDEERIRANVTAAIKKWLQPASMNRTRSIPELLTAIPDLLDTSVVPEGAICREPLTLSAAPPDVKKAYIRAVRLVHPDKLMGSDLDLEKKIMAQEIFIHISEKYDLYRKAHGL